MPARPAISSISASSFIAAIRPGAVELGDLAGVRAAKASARVLRLAEQGVDGGLGVVPGTVEQVGEVPRDLLQIGIRDGLRGGHTPQTRRAGAPEALEARRPSMTIEMCRRHASRAGVRLAGAEADAAHEHRDVVEHEVGAEVAGGLGAAHQLAERVVHVALEFLRAAASGPGSRRRSR